MQLLTASHLKEIIELLKGAKRIEDPYTHTKTRIDKLIAILHKELSKHE